jgi:DNA-binding IclR family transcriptional regulator
VAGVAVTYPEGEVDAAQRAQLAGAVRATATVLSRGIGG